MHICSCVPWRCVWQTTHFLRQLNCAVEPNGGDYGRCWVSPRSSKKPPRPMVRRREISLEIFSDSFIFASNSKHQKMIKYLGGAAKCHLVLWWADWFQNNVLYIYDVQQKVGWLCTKGDFPVCRHNLPSSSTMLVHQAIVLFV